MFKVLYSAYELRRAKLILTNRPIITLFGRIAASDWLAKHIASIVRVACVSGVERGTARGKGNLGARERVWGAGHAGYCKGSAFSSPEPLGPLNRRRLSTRVGAQSDVTCVGSAIFQMLFLK